MAQTFTKLHLSGSTDGAPIKVLATATPGTTIHTATTSTDTSAYDEVYVYATSTGTAVTNMTVHVGTVSGDNGQSIDCRVPAAYNGLIAVIPGLPYRNGLVLTATAATAGAINLVGCVNRIAGQ